MANGLAIIGMERLRKVQKETYSKVRIIYQDKNGIAGNY